MAMTATADCSPYRSASVPPADELETRSVLKKCVAAQAALADLRVAAQSVEDPALCTSNFALLEARDSCQIANVVTTIDALFRAANGLNVVDDGAARQVLRYRSALLAAVASPNPEPHSVATASRLADSLTPETGSSLLDEHHLAERLTAWTQFQDQPYDMEPLVHWAVVHYLFAATQPFALATGPIGRILSLLGLMNAGMLDKVPLLYLSRYLLATKADYDRRLSAVTETGAWHSYLDYMLTALELSGRWSTGKLRASRTLMDLAGAHIRSHAPKVYSTELTGLLFAEPYTRVSHLVDAGIARRQTAAVYLKQLASIGILKELKVGRDKVFVHRKYLYLMARDENTVTPYPAPVPAP